MRVRCNHLPGRVELRLESVTGQACAAAFVYLGRAFFRPARTLSTAYPVLTDRTCPVRGRTPFFGHGAGAYCSWPAGTAALFGRISATYLTNCRAGYCP